MIHARILNGTSTDAQNSTTMLSIDPATGTTIVKSFDDFIVKYEAEVKKKYYDDFGRTWPSTYNPTIQIIHW
jgi:hypothetical protein